MTISTSNSPSKNSLSDRIHALLQPQVLFSSALAGLLVGLLQITLSISFAALIFKGDAAAYLSRGIGMALFSATALVVVTTLLTSSPALMAGNQSAPAAIVAVMAASITVMVVADEARLATIVAAVALTTLTAGLFLLGLGTFKLAGLARFLPYPVAGGFLAGTGWLLVVGGISTMSRLPFSFTELPALFEPGVLRHWLPGLLLGALIITVTHHVRQYLVMPTMIIAIFAGFYLVAALFGMSPAELSADGWLLGPFPGGRLWQPVTPAELAQVDWTALLAQLPNLISAVIISAIALLLNASSLELAMNRDLDLNREMRIAGASNLASGLGAGFLGYMQLSVSTLTERMGAANRLTGLIAAAVCGATLLVGGAALGFVPTVVLGSLLVYLGLWFLWEWVVEARTRLPRVDYFIVLLILVVIAAAGFLQGVVVGIIATVAMFVVSYSRTSVVKHELSGATFKSRVTRSPDVRLLLNTIGDQAYILQLQGFIFFGTAYGLLEQVRARIRRASTRYIVLDFRQVIGLDSTALLSFDKMRQLARENNFTLVLSGLSPSLRQQFSYGGLNEEPNILRFASDLDRAAEWCEDQLCAVNPANTADRMLADYLQDIVPGAATARLVDYMERREVTAGDYIIRQGVDSDHLFFIESGQVTAQLELPNSAPMRLETMQGGRTVGELGFYLGTRRSAAVVADLPSVVYSLSQSTLARMEKEDPEAAHAVHRVIVHLLGERVLHLMGTVEALQA